MACDFLFVDSGTGGLPYFDHLKKVCPAAKCVYLADNGNFPYGLKTKKQILECLIPVLKLNVERFQPRAIVIACNTMSVNVLEELRSEFPIPVVGTVPAIKVAASVTRNKVIGLLATKATVENPYIQKLKSEFASDCTLVLREDSELIDFIEKKSFTATSEECDKACQPAMDFFLEQGCDAVILGCTHFLNLSENFKRISQGKAAIVDSRDGVVKQALKVAPVELSVGECNKSQIASPSPLVFTSLNEGDMAEYSEVCKRYNLALY